MPSVASEANTAIHHRPKASSNSSAANGRNGQGPFASLLDIDVEKPAPNKPQSPAPKQPARKSQAASDARPANPSKQARPAQIHASAPGQLHSASATPDAQAVPLNGLAVEIAARAAAGKNRFEVRLDPPELGRIDVRLDVDREGNVTSRLVIERADTYDLLRRDASTLERALQNAGLKTSEHALEFSLRDQGFARRDEQRETSRNAAQLIVSDEFAGETVNRYDRLIGLGAGIDIRV